MKIHYLQHASFEDPASILSWAKTNRHSLSRTRLYLGEQLPDENELDLLIIMGGPMSVTESPRYPWLQDEVAFIQRCIAAHKTLLGICLGAQLIARALGARVWRQTEKEIGWHPVWKTAKANNLSLLDNLADEFMAFHWHGETFDLPAGAQPLFRSQACELQGFIYGEGIIGLQFHLETTADSVAKLIEHCRHELVTGEWIQSEKQMLNADHYFRDANRLMENILCYLQGCRDDPAKEIT